MNNPKVNILVLNWNGRHVLNDCLNSILNSKYDNFIITVIDNASNDDSFKNLPKNKKIKKITIKKNLGYAKGYNYAFKKLKSDHDDYYLLLNNDTIVNENTISNLIYAVKKFGSNNIYGPRITSVNKINWFCGGGINLINGMPFHFGVNSPNTISFKTREVDYISGCCMLISKNLINQLSGFNEIYKMYYEDADLCMRAKKIGVKCYFISNASIKHFVSHSVGGQYSLIKYYNKFPSFIKFLFVNNNIIIFLFYLITNLLFCPFYIIYFLNKRLYA